MHTDNTQHDHRQRTPADSPQAFGLLGDFRFGHDVAIIRDSGGNSSRDFAARLMLAMRVRMIARCAVDDFLDLLVCGPKPMGEYDNLATLFRESASLRL